VRAKEDNENDGKANRRNARQRRAQRSHGKKMKKNGEDSEGGRPAENRDEPRARFGLGLVGADHVARIGRREISVCEKTPGRNLSANWIMRLARQVPDVARLAVCALKISSIFSARTKSRSLIPFTLCVTRSNVTRFHTLAHSGWWFIASANSATRVMLPNAALKSLHSKVLCSFPFTARQPGILLSSLSISSSVSLRAGMCASMDQRPCVSDGRSLSSRRYYEAGRAPWP